VSKIVVSDASPLNYLALIGAVDLLPRLFAAVLIPPAVAAELSSEDTPQAVSFLIRNLPQWLEIRAPAQVDASLGLDAGESEAIALASELGIRAFLMDERKGRRIATEHGLLTVGTLAILEQAASKGWIDFEEHVQRIRKTTFRLHERLIAEALLRLGIK
jgi:predicted nucleic acid-binding protein